MWMNPAIYLNEALQKYIILDKAQILKKRNDSYYPFVIVLP